MEAPEPKAALRPAVVSASRNRTVGVVLLALAGGMVGAAFAAVPLYEWFCRTTGFGGTTQVATTTPTRISDRAFTILFDANVQSEVPWRFRADVDQIRVRAGEVATVMYEIENTSAQTIRANAVYNVTPDMAGGYFNKIACFCFTEQTLGPHEKIRVPVTFFVDPDIDRNSDANVIKAITLSYTFFPALGAPPVATGALQTPKS